ncbi:MAG: FecR family protein [Candidatus Cloacimonetes bacterium]|nr:FecR family protein [Candidatus Cloacimonadota bacterium]
MKQIILAAILLVLLTSISFAESPVALTLRMRGDITLQRADKENKLHEGLPLINRDVLNSRDDSFAFIKFIDDGATVRLFANSILSINADKEDDKLNKTSFLSIGTIFSNINSRRGRYEIETPTTVASVKGTEGFIDTEEDGTTYIITLKGEFEVENTISGRQADVPAGYTCKSSPNGDLEVYLTEEIDQEWLDAIADMPHSDSNKLKIEIMNQDNERKIIEIELE